MMTIVTHVTLREGCEPEWDAAMRERLDAAKNQPGWIGGQLLIPLDRLDKRMIVGTWETRAAWDAWHQDPTFCRDSQASGRPGDRQERALVTRGHPGRPTRRDREPVVALRPDTR